MVTITFNEIGSLTNKQKATINHIHVISTFTYVVRVLEFVLEAERKTHLQFLISLFRKKQFREKKTHTQRHGHCSSVSLNNAAFCMTFLTTRIEPTWSINIWIFSSWFVFYLTIRRRIRE